MAFEIIKLTYLLTGDNAVSRKTKKCHAGMRHSAIRISVLN